MKTRRAYGPGVSDKLLDQIAEAIEVVIVEYIDKNHDFLAQQYIQPRMQGGTPRTEAFLSKIRADADTFMDDVLPQAMLDNISVQRLGLDKFIADRLTEGELSNLADRAMRGVQAVSSSLTAGRDMKPSQAANELRRIASAIQNSKNPDRRMVASAIRRVLAAVGGPGSVYESGKPGDPGHYSLTVGILSQDANKTTLSVDGVVFGKEVSGKVGLFGQAPDWQGYEYVATPGTFDISDDLEGVGQPVLDACGEEAGGY